VKKGAAAEKSETTDSDVDPKKEQLKQKIGMISEDLADQDQLLLNKTLMQVSPVFKAMITSAKNKLNLLPPSSAMAGIYTMVDSERGVWKAPANVSLNSVVSPAVNISHDDQEDLNVDINGKSINAIRSFIGRGVLVWGARTLDGNSLDWRYMNVRRTLIMLEESIKQAAKAYVFENNNANTWVTIKSMISNFLTGIWKRGGLAGTIPSDAFSVHVGLGETMTSEDILEGILRVTVLVAVTRPAEFIEITFQQQMQKS
jgi:phage tail sheath protein FI